MTSTISRSITLLRFPLCVAVVFIHSFGQPVEYDLNYMQTNPIEGYSIFNYIRICFSHILPNVAVPTFFLISGYLFFGGMEDTWNWADWLCKIKKRGISLLIPYLLWNMIAIIPKYASQIIKLPPPLELLKGILNLKWIHLFWDSHIMTHVYYNWLGKPVVNTGPVNVPLWFIRDLM